MEWRELFSEGQEILEGEQSGGKKKMKGQGKERRAKR